MGRIKLSFTFRVILLLLRIYLILMVGLILYKFCIGL